MLVGQREHCISGGFGQNDISPPHTIVEIYHSGRKALRCLFFIYPHKPLFGPRLNLLECKLPAVLVGSRCTVLAAPDSKVICIHGSPFTFFGSPWWISLMNTRKRVSNKTTPPPPPPPPPLRFFLQFMHPALVVLDLYSGSSVL